ncbi:ATPase domain-containing protein [Haloferax sulfurifontis]|uniref:non-specific serine/threonine protein kinase n=1 Tax=Haloferax sulfurifontis ATCC BAA-897 TaxID=662480 RepID=M0HUQ1_9EURY|nr:ATPase domain-containing protein [Haloferax sulfurifontis]ELZ88345.1 circadian clock protein, KaiC [Haloferax sulfurifontis ATCC BAA-897]
MNDTTDTTTKEQGTVSRISTGISGLDEILRGGLIPERSYLVRGRPGTGKTILGLHYLTTGAANGETSLFINLEEEIKDIEQNGDQLGFDLTGIDFLDLSPKSDFFTDDQGYDIFESSQVERDPFVESISDKVTELEPDRVFVDPITQLRYLTGDEYQFRKQALSFMRMLSENGATVLFTTQATDAKPDDDLQFMSDGTIELGDSAMGHTIDVPKFRGSSVQDGHHAMEITDAGIEVYPELHPGKHDKQFESESISSGVPALDEMLNGGIERGTVTVISGPTGAGKTTLGTHFMKEAAERGERSLMYLFEESAPTLRTRSEAIDIPIREMEERGTLAIEEVEPLDLSPQQFAQDVRREIEGDGGDIVMIDGIRGYQLSIQGGQQDLTRKLHALCRYLTNMGVTVVLVDESSTVMEEFSATDSGVSYLADNILFLRHIEYGGELRKVTGVLKKRTSDFERALRELEITESGLEVSDPLTGLRGILSGTPEWSDDASTEG